MQRGRRVFNGPDAPVMPNDCSPHCFAAYKLTTQMLSATSAPGNLFVYIAAFMIMLIKI